MNKTLGHIKLFAVTLLLLCLGANASAVSLAGRTTDDSVCDLSPLTSYRLASKTFVADGTKNSDQIYTRLALRFITKNCTNNQTLILDSDFGSEFDLRYFRNVSNQLCKIAEIQRISYATEENPNAFQIRCRIVKLQEATKWLSDAENVKPTETMISEGAPNSASSVSSTSATTSGARPNDCSRISLSSVFFGGGACK